jgi:hypothetical protein
LLRLPLQPFTVDHAQRLFDFKKYDYTLVMLKHGSDMTLLIYSPTKGILQPSLPEMEGSLAETGSHKAVIPGRLYASNSLIRPGGSFDHALHAVQKYRGEADSDSTTTCWRSRYC